MAILVSMAHLNWILTNVSFKHAVKRLAIILIAARDSLWLGRAGRLSQAAERKWVAMQHEPKRRMP